MSKSNSFFEVSFLFWCFFTHPNYTGGSIQSAHYRKQKRVKIKRNCLRFFFAFFCFFCFFFQTPKAKKDNSSIGKQMAVRPRHETRTLNQYYQSFTLMLSLTKINENLPSYPTLQLQPTLCRLPRKLFRKTNWSLSLFFYN